MTEISPERETATRWPLACCTVLRLLNLTRTVGFHLDVVDRGRTRCGTTDVEGTHGQLRARLADGLRGNDADRFADVDQVATSQVAPVAIGANAEAGFRR